MSGDRLGELAQMGVVRLGHEQRVAVVDRIDVEEGHGLGRLEYPGRRDLAVDDLAEDAVRIVRSMAHDATLLRSNRSRFTTERAAAWFLSRLMT